MRLARILKDGKSVYCTVEAEGLRLINGDILGEWTSGNETVAVDGAEFLTPCDPSKIVAVGLNYHDHIEEMKHEKTPEEPVIFIKPATCAIAQGEKIKRPASSGQVDYEGELAVVIKKQCKNIEPEEACEYILGYTVMNDVTARDLQSKDGQWTRGKGFDTFAPFGPWIETDFDPSSGAKLRSILNGKVKQSSTTDMMIHSPDKLISFISKVMTLLPGDVVATGTPSGVGPMVAGDVITIEIEGIGALTNTVTD